LQAADGFHIMVKAGGIGSYHRGNTLLLSRLALAEIRKATPKIRREDFNLGNGLSLGLGIVANSGHSLHKPTRPLIRQIIPRHGGEYNIAQSQQRHRFRHFSRFLRI